MARDFESVKKELDKCPTTYNIPKDDMTQLLNILFYDEVIEIAALVNINNSGIGNLFFTNKRMIFILINPKSYYMIDVNDIVSISCEETGLIIVKDNNYKNEFIYNYDSGFDYIVERVMNLTNFSTVSEIEDDEKECNIDIDSNNDNVNDDEYEFNRMMYFKRKEQEQEKKEPISYNSNNDSNSKKEDRIELLYKLKSLLDSELITRQEFDNEKKRILKD